MTQFWLQIRSRIESGHDMALSHKAKKRWALVVLIIGLPVYIVVALNVVALFDRPPLWLEFMIYVALGIVWAIPLRSLFLGVGQADPDGQDHTNKNND